MADFKQQLGKNYLIALAGGAAGALGCVLPWVSVAGISGNFMHGPGIFCFIEYLGVAAMAALPAMGVIKMEKKIVDLVLLVFAVGAIHISGSGFVMMMEACTPGIGAWVAVGGGAAALYGGFMSFQAGGAFAAPPPGMMPPPPGMMPPPPPPPPPPG